MPSLVRPWIVTYRNAAGRKVNKSTPGATRHRSRSPKWYGQGVPGYPPRKRVPLAKDKQVAKKMLADIVANAERGIAAMTGPGRIRLAPRQAAEGVR